MQWKSPSVTRHFQPLISAIFLKRAIEAFSQKPLKSTCRGGMHEQQLLELDLRPRVEAAHLVKSKPFFFTKNIQTIYQTKLAA